MIWEMIKRRLGEASTWKGLIAIAVGLGMKLSDAQAEAITTAMVAIYTALSILLPDSFTDKK